MTGSKTHHFHLITRSCLVVALFIMAALMTIPSPSAWCFDLRRIETKAAAAKQNQMIFLDARPRKKWQENHIPDALSFSWETYTGTDKEGVKYRILPPEELAAALGELGIRNTDKIVVYGDADSSWGGEGWLAWLLAWLGHQGPVYYLDGGFSCWQANGQPVSNAVLNSRAPVVYSIQIEPRVSISGKEIAAQGKAVNLIDNRGYLTEWLPGHLPGAIHIPWEKFHEGPHRRALSPEALKALLIKHGGDMQKPVVYYCTGGIRSGFPWMVHQLSGLPGAVNFEGGTEEWNAVQSAGNNRK